MLQQLDVVRNALYDELQRFKQYILDRKAELDHYNELLLLQGDELLRAFGRSVDSTARDPAQKAYEVARGSVDALQEAAGHAARLARGAHPFEVDRLSIAGALSAVEGVSFTAEADVYFNIFPERRLARVSIAVDFADLPGSAAAAARHLWEKRDQIRYLDEWELRRRESMMPLDAQMDALRAAIAAVGPQFGESWRKKLLYDMDSVELAHFYDYARGQLQRFPVLARALEVVQSDYGFIIERVIELLKPDSPEGPEGRQVALDALRYAERAFKSEFERTLARDRARLTAALAQVAAPAS